MRDGTLGSVIAIDGPAASGKSSVARALAQRLGFAYVNSGGYYRAVAWLANQRGISAPSEVLAEVDRSKFTFGLRDKESFVLIDGVDPATHLQDENVNRVVPQIAAIPVIRQFLVSHLRELSSLGDLVMEGRDIGTVVFPNTPYKFYIDASPEVRARRRAAQGLQDDLSYRDRVDSNRETAPLMVADDACVIDTSALTIEGVVNEILGQLQRKGLPEA
jgi:cytidylate kinase